MRLQYSFAGAMESHPRRHSGVVRTIPSARFLIIARRSLPIAISTSGEYNPPVVSWGSADQDMQGLINPNTKFDSHREGSLQYNIAHPVTLLSSVLFTSRLPRSLRLPPCSYGHLKSNRSGL